MVPKMRTGFPNVRILENPGDFFEDAHPFPRCARKVRTFEDRSRYAQTPGSFLLFCQGGGAGRTQNRAAGLRQRCTAHLFPCRRLQKTPCRRLKKCLRKLKFRPSTCTSRFTRRPKAIITMPAASICKWRSARPSSPSLAAIAALLAGHAANEALLEQIKASDQWSYYQSKSIKERSCSAPNSP